MGERSDTDVHTSVVGCGIVAAAASETASPLHTFHPVLVLPSSGDDLGKGSGSIYFLAIHVLTLECAVSHYSQYPVL